MDVPTMREFNELKEFVSEIYGTLKSMQKSAIKVDWVGIENAKIVLNCSETTVWRLCKKGEIAYEKRGRSIRYSLDSIRAYLERQRFRPEIVESRINSLFAA